MSIIGNLFGRDKRGTPPGAETWRAPNAPRAEAPIQRPESMGGRAGQYLEAAKVFANPNIPSNEVNLHLGDTRFFTREEFDSLIDNNATLRTMIERLVGTGDNFANFRARFKSDPAQTEARAGRVPGSRITVEVPAVPRRVEAQTPPTASPEEEIDPGVKAAANSLADLIRRSLRKEEFRAELERMRRGGVPVDAALITLRNPALLRASRVNVTPNEIDSIQSWAA